MAPGLHYIRSAWLRQRAASRQAAEAVAATHKDRDLSQEGRQRRAAGIAARAALDIAPLMREAQATRQELAATLAAITPKRSSDPVEALQAHRLLDQLSRLDDQGLQTAVADPAIRETIARYGTALDAQTIERRLPQTEQRKFSVAAIREELAARDYPDKLADDQRRLREADELIAEMAGTFSLLQAGDASTLATALATDGPVPPTPSGRHLYHHLVGDPRALPGAQITLDTELAGLRAAAAAIAPARPAPLPVTAAGAAIGGEA